MKTTGLLAFLFLQIALFILPARAEEGWTTLFNGKNLEGWTADLSKCEVKAVDGEIHITAGKNLWYRTTVEMKDFILEAEFKLPEGKGMANNSGLAFRGKLKGKASKPNAYQCEVDNTPRNYSGAVYNIGKGWIYPKKDEVKPMQEKVGKAYKLHQWNHFKIQCQGDHIKTWVNGIPIADIHDKTYDSGFFAIQHHGGKGVFKFRNLRVKKL